MTRSRYVWLTLMILMSASAFAQKAERDYIRKGNRAFKDSVYVDAEVDYRKALDANPQSTIARFNLGNTLLWQNKAQEAMNEFADAARIEKDKGRKAQIFHNMGVIFHTMKEYEKAIEAYKESLRNNPNDDETRYNLALAQKMLKDQQQNQQNQKGKCRTIAELSDAGRAGYSGQGEEATGHSGLSVGERLVIQKNNIKNEI